LKSPAVIPARLSKRKECFMLEDFVKVARTDELSPGQMKLIEIGDDRILLVNLEGEYHAMDEICSHAFAALSEGDLTGEEVECPLHGSAFNVKTGEALSPPADEALTVYSVRVEDNDILIGPPNV
jgi:3-phenylpropionate/trans-cinnamate dioxygenase ferredoxin subunit